MTDSDPPHEINDGESPADGDIDSPNPDADRQQKVDRQVKETHESKSKSQPGPPSALGLFEQDDGADLVRDRGVGVPRNKDRNIRPYRRRIWSLSAPNPYSLISGLGLRNLARYVVRGRVFKSSKIP